MATNFFFQNYSNFGEQELLESLIIESIKIYGHDAIYIPRKIINPDRLHTSDDQSLYSDNYNIDVYIESYDGFQGKGNFMSKFGLEIRDQVVFSIAQRTFMNEVGNHTTLIRPMEGDIIYFPLNKKCYQITYVDKFEIFYQLGRLYSWNCTTELFEYSNEKFETGIPEIDSIVARLSTDILSWSIRTEGGDFITDEEADFVVLEHSQPYDLQIADESDQIQTEGSKFIDFSEKDPFSEGLY